MFTFEFIIIGNNLLIELKHHVINTADNGGSEITYLCGNNDCRQCIHSISLFNGFFGNTVWKNYNKLELSIITY